MTATQQGVSQSSTDIMVRPLTGSIGAEISGLDLRALTANTFATIEQAFLDNCMLVFRDQHLNVEEHEAFAAWWGEIGVTPFIDYIDDHPGVLILSNLGKAESVTENWHYDSTFLPAPHKMTILSAHQVPVGGDTMWANQYLAYETLSAGMQDMLDGVQAMFAGTRLARRVSEGGEVPFTYHPIVRTHPQTGRKALFIGHPGDTVPCLENMNEADSRPLLDYLYAHSVSPDRIHRHSWRNGDVVLWDNRCTMHYAIHDYGTQDRIIHRISIKGDVPR